MHSPRTVILALVLLTVGISARAQDPHRALKHEIHAWSAKVVDAYKLRDGLAEIPTMKDVCDVGVADGSIYKSKKAWLDWSMYRLKLSNAPSREATRPEIYT